MMSNGRDEKGHFLPGHKAPNNYADWIKKLTPEERDAHLIKRRKKATRKADLAAIIDENRAEWLADIHNAMRIQIEKAKLGDTKALDSIYDKIIGKDKESLDVLINPENSINVNFKKKDE